MQAPLYSDISPEITDGCLPQLTFYANTPDGAIPVASIALTDHALTRLKHTINRYTKREAEVFPFTKREVEVG